MKYKNHFDSPFDLVREANQPLPESWGKHKGKSAREYGEAGMAFMGGTLPESSALATKGWGDAPKLDGGDLSAVLASLSESNRLDTFASVTGAILDVGAFCSGEPECFLEFCETPQPRAINLAFSIGGAARISRDQKARQGAVGMALIEWLVSSGLHVGVMGYHASDGRNGHESTVSFALKRPEEPLDVNQLAYWLCHDSAQRQIMFSWQDVQDETRQKRMRTKGDRGYSKECTAEELAVDYVLPMTHPSTDAEAVTLFRQAQADILAMLEG